MKKTLIAALSATSLTVLMGIPSANAAMIYQDEGAKIELSGSIRVLLGKPGNKERWDLQNDGSRIILKGHQDLSNGFGALAGYELRFRPNRGIAPVRRQGDDTASDFGDPNTEQLYAGLTQKEVGLVRFGRFLNNADKVELGDYTYAYGGNNNLSSYTDKGINYLSASWHGLKFGADYAFGNSRRGTDTPNTSSSVPDRYRSQIGSYKYGYGFTLFYTAQLAEFTTLNFNAGLTRDVGEQIQRSDTGVRTQAYRLAAELIHGPYALAVNFGERRRKYTLEDTPAEINKYQSVLVGAKYQVTDPTAIYLQWNRDGDLISFDKEHNIIAGTDYQITSNIVTFIEYNRILRKEPNKNDNRFGAGLRVFF